ncbi:MAG: Sec-independent protein translocase subunit TatA [Burkholderiaceae bacterium]
MGSMSLLHWGVVLLIVMLVFGTKKLANIGADLGAAVKGFKDGVKGDEEKSLAEVTACSSIPAPPGISIDTKEKFGN